MKLETGLLILGILFIIAAMLSFGRSRRKTSAGNTTARDNLERARAKQGVRDDLESLMVDIEQMARRLSAQLDAKSLRVEKAVREADERIAQLDALRQELAQPAVHHGDTQPAEAGGASPPPADADPLTREVYALADQGQRATDIARQLKEHVGKVELILALRKA